MLPGVNEIKFTFKDGTLTMAQGDQGSRDGNTNSTKMRSRSRSISEGKDAVRPALMKTENRSVVVTLKRVKDDKKEK